MNLDLYFEEQRKRVRKIYNGKKHFAFINRDFLADWYVQQLKKMKVNVIIVKHQFMILIN